MADAVERAIDEHRFLLCEAGTGTGKTLAYLVPAALSGKRVVIATATRNLQEQIVEKDLPVLGEHLGIETSVAVVKGLTNYLCLRRFEEARRGFQPTLGGGDGDLGLLERWVSNTSSGDLAELGWADDHALIGRVSSSSDTRIGAGCAHYDRCFVTRMKRRAEEARLIVANHHVLFADLALRAMAGEAAEHRIGVLPPYDVLILDEAHGIEDTATDFFGSRTSTNQLATLARELAKADEKRPVVGTSAAKLARQLESTASAFFSIVERSLSDEERSAIDERQRGALWDAYAPLDEVLEALESQMDSVPIQDPRAALARRVGSTRAALASALEPEKHHVVWAERRGRHVAVGTSPVEVGALLRKHLLPRVQSLILTSATLASAGSQPFAFARSRMGLTDDLWMPVDEAVLASPFDYPNNAVLYLPNDLPDVTDASFSDVASARVAELIRLTSGGAFVLCTSTRVMRAMAAALRASVSWPVLMQGERPKTDLLDQFRTIGNAVLVATMSFWEGVDVAGDALRLVVLDRIPFSVPTDPVFKARSLAIEAEGRNPFVEYAVPEAAMKLKQGFGRLIRTTTDRGIVALLDKRIQSRGYGSKILATLPPAKVLREFEAVKTTWQAWQGG